MDSLDPLPGGTGYRASLKRISLNTSYFGDHFDHLTATFTYESDYRLRIRIVPFDSSANEEVLRYEVPLQINPPSEPLTSRIMYELDFLNNPVFGFQVKRKSSGAILFDTTSLGGFTYSDQFIQLSIKLPTSNVYGLGENEQHSYRQSFERYESYPFFARGHNTNGNTNLYGVQPYYTVVENDGRAHSVMILNSNAMEFVKTPAPGYVYRTIGGILDIYIFTGPTPEELDLQFAEAIGRSPLPPYWALGFQLCRYGYDTIENMQAAVNRTALYQIPHDVQYGDIDIMDRRLDFTYDPVAFSGLPNYIEDLKAKGIKFVTILDPPISSTEPNYEALELGNEMDVWVRRADGTPFLGRMWPDGPVYFPDYSRNATQEWWTHLIVEFQKLLKWDGLWIDMNEPANFIYGDVDQGPCDSISKYNHPPYIPPIAGGRLPDATICMDTLQDFGTHYDTHSLYGWSMAEATLKGVRAATGKRSLVITRSTYLGVGKWASHWLEDNYSTWDDLYYSIIGMLQFNQFGIPYVGADICGHNLDCHEELCTRWHQLGAFYPYARNHNGYGQAEQDPGAYGEASAASTRRALLIRYTLLPYLYSLFYDHAEYGFSVVRPLWHAFSTDKLALGIDRQFMWGDGLLISPVLTPASITVRAYFPRSRWYSYYDGKEVASVGAYVTLGAPIDFINLHVHGGSIIPTQEPAVNTELSKRNPYGLIVPLDSNRMANGILYVDDGDSIEPQISGDYFLIEYSTNGNRLTSAVLHNGYDVTGKVLGTVRLMGLGRPIAQLIVNGSPHSNYTYNPESGEIYMQGLNLALGTRVDISWS